MGERLCAIDGCDKKVQARGWCTAHYTKYRRWGDPLGTGPLAPNGLTRNELFLRKVQFSPEHWLWTGRVNNRGKGYGVFTFKVEGRPKTVAAHRYGWQLWVGPLTPDQHLDHVADRCDVTHCIWPKHLEPVTLQENTRRFYALQTRCKWGHPFDEQNTRVVVTEEGFIHRICRACARRRNREYIRNHRPHLLA